MNSNKSIEDRVRIAHIETDAKVDDAVRRDVLRAFDRARDQQTAALRPALWRQIMTSKAFKATAALAVVATVVVWAVLIGNGGATIAFADVRELIVSAETISYSQTVPLASGQTLRIRHFAKGTEHLRWEMTPLKPDGTPYYAVGPSAIMIADFASGRMLALYPEKKEASIEFFGELPPNSRRMVGISPAYLKELLAGKEESLGERRINETKAVGFRVASRGSREIELWIDAETEAPLLIEIEAPLKGPFSGNLPITISDIRINEDLADSLFDLSLPEGYKLRKGEPGQAN